MKEKKIIHIYTEFYNPDSNAMSIRANNYVEILRKKYNVEIVTTKSDLNGNILTSKEKGTFGESIIRLWDFPTKNRGTILRTLNYLSFMLSSFFNIIFGKKTNVVIVFSPSIFTAIGIMYACKIKKIPYILEVHDLWPDSIVEFNIIKKGSIIFNILKYFEKNIYSHSKGIIGLTKGVCDGIREELSKKEQGKVILNYFVSKKIKKQNINPYFKYKKNIGSKKIALFAGNMNSAYDFVSAFKYMKKHPKIFFVFIGDGLEKKYILENAKTLNNIIVIDRMSKNKVDAFLYYSDIVFIPLQDKKFYEGTFPVKGIEAIVNKKEIIFLGPKQGEFFKFINGKTNGKKEFSLKNFKNNIIKLINNIGKKY